MGREPKNKRGKWGRGTKEPFFPSKLHWIETGMAVVILLNYLKTKEMLKNWKAKWLGCVLTLPIYRGRGQHGKGREAEDKGTGSGRAGYGRREAGDSDPPAHPPTPPPLCSTQVKCCATVISNNFTCRTYRKRWLWDLHSITLTLRRQFRKEILAIFDNTTSRLRIPINNGTRNHTFSKSLITIYLICSRWQIRLQGFFAAPSGWQPHGEPPLNSSIPVPHLFLSQPICGKAQFRRRASAVPN